MTQSTPTKANNATQSPQFSGERVWWPYLVFAMVTLLLAFAWSGYRAEQAPERLFAEYFDPVPQADFSAQRAVVGVRPNSDALLEQALAYHLEGNYSYALAAWRSFLEEYENQLPRAYLYAANAAMATGKDELAAYYLQQLAPDEGGALGEEINWYRALLVLKTEGPLAATATLKKLPEQLRNANVRQNKESLLRALEAFTSS